MTEDAIDRSVGRHQRADARLGLRIHASVYVAVNLFLALIWALTSGLSEMPWFLFPLGGWGIGLAAHYAAVRPRTIS